MIKRLLLTVSALLFACNIFGQAVPLPDTAEDNLMFGMPGKYDILLNRKGFASGYSQKYRQPVWVSYILTADELSGTRIPRKNDFLPDPAIKTNPVTSQHYASTGYDRGHMAPAADMAFSMISMENSFYMSNISPQLPGCNRGIWKRLETQVRRWAMQEKKICVVCGPVFAKRNKNLGNTGIKIPYAYYKVILDMTPPMKMIGFIIPNEASKKRLKSFSVSVDQVEELTGLDFFRALPDKQENKLEAENDFEKWMPPYPIDRNE